LPLIGLESDPLRDQTLPVRARVFTTSIHSSQSVGPFGVTEIFWEVDMVVLDAIGEDYSTISVLY
jgi:hypothetical protein